MKKILTASLMTLLSQFALAGAVFAQCPDGYDPVILAEYPELAACSCSSGEEVCIDGDEAPDGIPLCTEAPECIPLPDEEDPEIPSCGTFSVGALFDYLSWEDGDYTAMIKKLKPLFADKKDLWSLREIEDDTAHAEMLDLIEYLVTPISEEESLDETFPDEDDGDYEEEPIDDTLPAEGMLCYSIEDLLLNLNEAKCTAKEKRIFTAAYPLLKKALAASGPFVSNEIEDNDTASDVRSLLHDVALKCLTKKELKKLQKKKKSSR